LVLPCYKEEVVVDLSKNHGYQNALLAGLVIAKDVADVVISMDADLQDDINAIDEMPEKFGQGFDIVYGVRSQRKKDSFFKRVTAEGFYTRKYMPDMAIYTAYGMKYT